MVPRDCTVKFNGIKGKITHVANNNPNYNPNAPKAVPTPPWAAQTAVPTLPLAGPPPSLDSSPWTSHSLDLTLSGLQLYLDFHLLVSLHFVSTLLASTLWAPCSPRCPLAGPPTPVGPPTLRSSESLCPYRTFLAPPFFRPLHSADLPHFCGFPQFWGLFTSSATHTFSSSHNILASYARLTSHTFWASHSLALYSPWPSYKSGDFTLLGPLNSQWASHTFLVSLTFSASTPL